MTDGTGLSTFATLDFDRAQRRGYPEAVYCEGKTVEQVRTIAAAHPRPLHSDHAVHPS